MNLQFQKADSLLEIRTSLLKSKQQQLSDVTEELKNVEEKSESLKIKQQELSTKEKEKIRNLEQLNRDQDERIHLLELEIRRLNIINERNVATIAESQKNSIGN